MLVHILGSPSLSPCLTQVRQRYSIIPQRCNAMVRSLYFAGALSVLLACLSATLQGCGKKKEPETSTTTTTTTTTTKPTPKPPPKNMTESKKTSQSRRRRRRKHGSEPSERTDGSDPSEKTLIVPSPSSSQFGSTASDHGGQSVHSAPSLIEEGEHNQEEASPKGDDDVVSMYTAAAWPGRRRKLGLQLRDLGALAAKASGALPAVASGEGDDSLLHRRMV